MNGTNAAIAAGLAVTFLCMVAAAADEPGERVVSLISQEKHAEARSALDPLLTRDPNAARLRLMDGTLRAREGKTAEAIAVFERLRNDRPDMFEPLNNLAVLYARQGRLEAAREALAEALERRPDAAAYANLGDVYSRLAERAYARARELGEAAVPGSVTAPPQPGSPPSAVPVEAPSPRQAAAPRPGSTAKNDGPLALVARDPGEATGVPSGKPAVPSATSRRCLHAGRFKDRAAATRSAEWLQKHGAELLEIRHERRRVEKNYRVFLPARPNSRRTAATVKELRDRGLRDVAIIARGPMAGRISLGLYESTDNANRRVAQLKKLGYPARSAANSTMLDEYAVSARIGGDRYAFDTAWKARFPENPVRHMDCE
ncbi:MAG: tetratricopeptide repeat protein [Defluviicoccus sp.]|nr:tetratricopeptide repeat protein [Defluviicoccus sp.]